MTLDARRPRWSVVVVLAVGVIAALTAYLVLPTTATTTSGRLVNPSRSPVPYTQQVLDVTQRPGDERPNIVLVLVDDMRTDELRYMPTTRRLLGGRAGRRFTHAISPHPLCCPARASLVTGQYGQNNGVQSNDGARGGFAALRSPDDNIGTWLQDSGYATSWHGKYLNGYGEQYPAVAGWTEWDPLVSGQYSYTSWRFWGETTGTQGYITDEITRRSIGTIDRFAAPGSPFFMVVNHTAPHYKLAGTAEDGGFVHKPPVSEPRYDGLFSRLQAPGVGTPAFNARPVFRNVRLRQSVAEVNTHYRQRLRSLQSVDASVAATVAELKATGELDNTVLVFASDNGFQLGEHRYVTKNVLYRESLDVPLLVRGPGVVPGSTSAVVSLVDLPSTFLDLADVRPGRLQDGASLTGFLRGRHPSWRSSTLVQVGSTPRGRIQPGWDARGVQTARYLYYEWVNHPDDPRAYVLFDRRQDPEELTNLARAPRYRAVVHRLARQAVELETCRGERCNRRYAALPLPARQPQPQRSRR